MWIASYDMVALPATRPLQDPVVVRVTLDSGYCLVGFDEHAAMSIFPYQLV